MIPLPNLPTDNLYKFLALSGVALYIFSVSVVVVTNNRWNDIDDRFAFSQELDSLENSPWRKRERAVADSQVAHTRRLLQRLQNEASDSLRRQAARLRAMSDAERRRDSVRRAVIDTMRNMLALDSLRRRLFGDLLHSDSAMVTDRMRMRQIRRDNALLDAMIRIQHAAALIALLGFVLWYTKVQKYQDMLLRRHALGDEGKNGRKSGEAPATDSDDAEDKEDAATV